MQARFESKRFPSVIVAALFALAVSLLLGGALGYALKPATMVSGPTHVVVVPAAQPSSTNPGDVGCQIVTHGNESIC
jgi:hypothetical protein